MECYRCGKPITGTPVLDPGDPLSRAWCSDECADDDSGTAYAQRYGAGVAT